MLVDLQSFCVRGICLVMRVSLDESDPFAEAGNLLFGHLR